MKHPLDSRYGYGGMGLFILGSVLSRRELPSSLQWVDPWITWGGIIVGLFLVAFALPGWWRKGIVRLQARIFETEPSPLILPPSVSRELAMIKRFRYAARLIGVFLGGLLIVAFVGLTYSLWRGSFVSIPDPLNTGSTAGEWQQHSFDLLREQGAELRLGRCPGSTCLQFALGEVSVDHGVVLQEFTLDGDSLWGRDPSRKGIVHSVPALMTFLHAGEIQYGKPMIGRLGLIPGNAFQMCGNVYDLQIIVTSAETSKLNLSLLVKAGTHASGPLEQRCAWMGISPPR